MKSSRQKCLLKTGVYTTESSLVGENTHWRGAIDRGAEALPAKSYGRCEEAREEVRKEESWVGRL